MVHNVGVAAVEGTDPGFVVVAVPIVLPHQRGRVQHPYGAGGVADGDPRLAVCGGRGTRYEG